MLLAGYPQVTRVDQAHGMIIAINHTRQVLRPGLYLVLLSVALGKVRERLRWRLRMWHTSERALSHTLVQHLRYPLLLLLLSLRALRAVLSTARTAAKLGTSTLSAGHVWEENTKRGRLERRCARHFSFFWS